MVVNALEYHENLKTNGINFIYNGPLWDWGIEGMAGALKKRLEYDKLPMSVAQSVFSVFVEQMNNMLMYSNETELFTMADEVCAESPNGIFILGSKGKTYFIQTGNVVKNENIATLKDKIDFINTLDKTGLRKYYKEQIRLESENIADKSAWLGFIEIARRISSKIEYAFTPYTETCTYFSMHVTIGGDN